MNEREVDDLKELLKSAVKPASGTDLSRDLWPAMLARISRHKVKVPWWDWALLAGASAALWFFPGVVPALLYHL